MTLENLNQNVRFVNFMRINKNWVLLLFCLSFFAGCSKNTTNDSIIDEDAFVDVLVDIHLADATLVVKGYKTITDSTTIRLFYNDILVKHNVTQKQIQNTLEYYAKKPKRFDDIYKQVSEKIVKLEEEYDKSSGKKKDDGKLDIKDKRIIEEYE